MHAQSLEAEEPEEEDEDEEDDSEAQGEREDADAALARRLQAEEYSGRGGRRGGPTRSTRGIAERRGIQFLMNSGLSAVG